MTPAVNRPTALEILRRKDVADWICGRPWFDTKKAEDTWGRTLCASIGIPVRRNQWSGKLGEYLVALLLVGAGHEDVRTQVPLCMIADDGQSIYKTADVVSKQGGYYEVKTRTYKTSGTAGEKIKSVFDEYAALRPHDMTPLSIVVLAGQEAEAMKPSWHIFTTVRASFYSQKQKEREEGRYRYITGSSLYAEWAAANAAAMAVEAMPATPIEAMPAPATTNQVDDSLSKRLRIVDENQAAIPAEI